MILDKVYRKNPDFVARQVADEFILVPIKRRLDDQNSLYVLDPIAADIWHKIDGKKTVAQIAKQLREEFEADSAQIESDLENLIGDLASAEAIREDPQ